MFQHHGDTIGLKAGYVVLQFQHGGEKHCYDVTALQRKGPNLMMTISAGRKDTTDTEDRNQRVSLARKGQDNGGRNSSIEEKERIWWR
jgi:hypothetical protein